MAENPGKILIVHVNAIGDIVMSMPSLRAIRKKFANSEIALLCQDWAPMLLRNENLIDRFICVRVPWTGSADRSLKSLVRLLKTLLGLRRQGFDMGICLRGDPKSIALLAMANARNRISYGEYFGRRTGKYLLRAVVPIESRGNHIMDWGRGVARHLGCDWEDMKTQYFTKTQSQLEYVKRFLESAGVVLGHHVVVAINPGHKSKLTGWETDRWREVLEYLQTKEQVRVLAFGAAYEKQAIEELISGSSAVAVIEPLEYLPVFAQFCDLIVCLDSGMAHIAALVGTYSVVLFGPADPAVTAPRTDRAKIVIKHGYDCRPCKRRKCLINGDLDIGACMQDIEVSDVIEAVELQWPHVLEQHEINGSNHTCGQRPLSIEL